MLPQHWSEKQDLSPVRCMTAGAVCRSSIPLWQGSCILALALSLSLYHSLHYYSYFLSLPLSQDRDEVEIEVCFDHFQQHYCQSKPITLKMKIGLPLSVCVYIPISVFLLALSFSCGLVWSIMVRVCACQC